MGLSKYYPALDARMGAILTLAGLRQTAILEFGPMGTANFGDMMLSAYGCDQGVLHFATHITDTQIALGDLSALEEAIDSIREHYSTRAIFVVPSAIAEITGSDTVFVCKEKSSDECSVVQLPPMGIGKDESFGVSATFDVLEQFVCNRGRDAFAGKRTFNIVGCVPNDYSALSDAVAISDLMREFFDAEPLCVMPWGSSFDELDRMGAADINLVIRHEGILLARSMEVRFAIPFVAGRPCGADQSEAWLYQIAQVTGWSVNENLLHTKRKRCQIAERRLQSFVVRVYRGRPVDILLRAGLDVSGAVGSYLRDLGLSVTALSDSSSPGLGLKGDEALWEKFIESHPGCLILGDASMKMFRGNRCAVISHPAGGRLDLSRRNPLVGFDGALHVVEVLWNLLHE